VGWGSWGGAQLERGGWVCGAPAQIVLLGVESRHLLCGLFFVWLPDPSAIGQTPLSTAGQFIPSAQ